MGVVRRILKFKSISQHPVNTAVTEKKKPIKQKPIHLPEVSCGDQSKGKPFMMGKVVRRRSGFPTDEISEGKKVG